MILCALCRSLHFGYSESFCAAILYGTGACACAQQCMAVPSACLIAAPSCQGVVCPATATCRDVSGVPVCYCPDGTSLFQNSTMGVCTTSESRPRHFMKFMHAAHSCHLLIFVASSQEEREVSSLGLERQDVAGILAASGPVIAPHVQISSTSTSTSSAGDQHWVFPQHMAQAGPPSANADAGGPSLCTSTGGSLRLVLSWTWQMLPRDRSVGT
jgi:hypothetical protein